MLWLSAHRSNASFGGRGGEVTYGQSAHHQSQTKRTHLDSTTLHQCGVVDGSSVEHPCRCSGDTTRTRARKEENVAKDDACG